MDDQETDRESGGSVALARRIANWINGIGWFGAFCGFMFAALCAPYDNSRFQFESTLVFISSMVLAATITEFRSVVIHLASDNWQFTFNRVLALMLIAPIFALAAYYLAVGLAMSWESF